MLYLDVLSTLLCSAGQSEAVPKGGTKNHSCSTCGLLGGWDTFFQVEGHSPALQQYLHFLLIEVKLYNIPGY